jgi:hypothetical protein
VGVPARAHLNYKVNKVTNLYYPQICCCVFHIKALIEFLITVISVVFSVHLSDFTDYHMDI